MLNEIYNFLALHEPEILGYFVIPFIVFTVAKFPDPRKFEEKWFYAPYFAFFTLATRYSAGDWREWGGKLTVPFIQYPNLKNVPPPSIITFKMPKFYKYDDEKTAVIK